MDLTLLVPNKFPPPLKGLIGEPPLTPNSGALPYLDGEALAALDLLDDSDHGDGLEHSDDGEASALLGRSLMVSLLVI